MNKSSKRYIIGIDAGATSTEAVLCKFNEGIVNYNNCKHFKFSPINFNLAGKENTIENLTSFIGKIIKGKNISDIRFISAGIAGARNEKDREYIRKQLSKNLKYKNISVHPDTEIAFASIFKSGEKNCGILIAGTGSILYYINNKGELLRIGGWGRYIDDEGSGYWIGRAALSRAVKCFDGRIKDSLITNALNKKHNLHNASIIKEVFHNKFEISKAAKIVFDCAEEGDRHSIDIIKEAAEKLSGHFIPIKNHKAAIALCGSLFTEEKLLEKYFRKIARQRYPNIKFIKPDKKPVWGAVEIGMQKLNKLNLSCVEKKDNN